MTGAPNPLLSCNPQSPAEHRAQSTLQRAIAAGYTVVSKGAVKVTNKRLHSEALERAEKYEAAALDAESRLSKAIQAGDFVREYLSEPLA